MSKCWYCGGELIWESDFPLDEVYGEDAGEGIVTYLHCSECNAQVMYEKSYRDDE